MKKLINKTNVAPVSAAYPYGDVKDDTGSGNGTPANRDLFADGMQFFEKLMAESGIVANGLPDNATNGFQLYEAFRKLSRPYSVYSARVGFSGGAFNIIVFEDSITGIVWSKNSTGTFYATKTGAFVTNKTFVINNDTDSSGSDFRSGKVSDNVIAITSYSGGTLTDSPMTEGCWIEIRIYD